MDMKINEIENGGVAIVGIGFRIPSGNNNKSINSPNDLFENLKNGLDGVIKTSERWSDNYHKLGEITSPNAGLLPFNEWKSFDPLFFGINPSEAPLIDPQQRLLLKCTWEALEDASIDPISVRGTNTSVFIGSSTIDYLHANKHEDFIVKNSVGFSPSTLPNRISYCFDFHGPSLLIDTACSSSMNCVIQGYQTILSGASNMSICGGVNFILDVESIKGFSNLNMLSKTHGKCKAFDESGDGFTRGECAAVVILKNLEDAINDGNNIYCVINGMSSNIDGNGISDKLNFYSPSKQSQVNNIKSAFKSTNGKLSPNDIQYVEAHGTGTKTGDPIETEAISMAFNQRDKSTPILIGSIKSNIGHCEAASGVASLIKCCLMFKNQCFLPNIHFNKPNPSIKFEEWNLKVVTEPTPFPNNYERLVSMMINNFGVTGSNCCLLLSDFKNQDYEYTFNSENNKKRNILIPFSANSPKSLEQYQSQIKNLTNSESSFIDFAKNQIYSKSNILYQRSVVISSSSNEFIEKLSNKNKIQTKSSITSNMSFKRKNPTTVFVFSGQGSQYPKMGFELYNNEPIFKQSMDLIDKKLSSYYGYSVLEKLRSINEDDNKSIHDPTIAQPAMCMFSISLFELYKHWGVNASFIIGHSLGEIPTSYCSGMIDLDTLCYTVYHRSIAQSKTHGNGRMLSINISDKEFISLYSQKYPQIEIACYNSSESIVVAGNESILNEISKELKYKGIFTAMLGSLSSFHTSSQEITKDNIMNLTINNKIPKIPTFSTVTTNLFDESTPFNSQYVYDNIINPVKFTQTISNLYKHIETNQIENDIVFIEIAPHPTLSFYLKQLIPSNLNESVSIYSSLHKKKNDVQEFQQTISNLYCQNGYNINFKCQFNLKKLIQKIQLPLYQWDDGIYFRQIDSHENHRIEGPPIDHLGLSNSYNSPFNKSFKTFIDLQNKPFQYLKGHMVKGKYYFPGCGYIDNIIKLYKNQDFIISFIEFKTPLILIEGINQCLQTNIYQTGKTEYRAQFHFKDQKSKEWVQSSSANFQLFNHGNDIPSKYNIQEIIKTKCNLTKLSKNELYTHIKSKTGLNYTGVFQGVKECYLGDDCAISVVSTESQTNSFFNAAILDTVFHGNIALLSEQSQIVFEKVLGFKYYSSNIPSNINEFKEKFIYVFSKLNSKIGDSFSASFVVMLSDGTVLYEIDEAYGKSLIPVKDLLKVEYPNNDLYSVYLQPKDSTIPLPLVFKPIVYENDIFKSSESPNENLFKYISTIFYNNIIKRIPEINFNIIDKLNIEEIISNYCKVSKHERLFKFVFETIKENGIFESLEENYDESYFKFSDSLVKSSRVIAKLLFPLEEDLSNNEDTPQSFFENGFINKLYGLEYLKKKNQMIARVIKHSINEIVNQNIIIRILEFGGGVASLSVEVIKDIVTLLHECPNYQVEIEYTWSDISPAFIPDAKNKINKIINEAGITNGLNVIYRPLTIDESLIDTQSIKPSYYDFIIMSNVLHVVKDIKQAVNQMYQLLTPNGQLLFVEPPYKSTLCDSLVGAFDQWWAFTDTDIRKDHCCLSQDGWYKLLNGSNFKNIVMSEESTFSGSVIQAQKPPISLSLYSQPKYENIVIYGNNSCFINNIKSFSTFNNLIQIETVQEFNRLVDESNITNNSIIYFIKTIDQLSLDNFKQITLEYIEINQKLLQINSFCKHVLIVSDSRINNYLASSVVGAARYFDEFQQLNLNTLDFDKDSTRNYLNSNNNKMSQFIDILIDSKTNIHKEMIIINNKVYYEIIQKQKNLKLKYKSESFEDLNNMICTLSPNLEYELQPKTILLGKNEVEVKTMATGINYKDYLIYNGLESGSIVEGLPQFGYEFSGIITRIGDNVKDYKIGDNVFGISKSCTSSVVVTNSEKIQLKPSNITHVEAASIPIDYLTSFISLFSVGGLSIEDNESVLIHSATSGVGLSTLEILKWKGFKSNLFVTVDSDEKKQYLSDNYGQFITGIYSTTDKNYTNQIKCQLMKLGSDDNGVDLILNTLPSDYMDANFEILSINGRIVDLSSDHLNQNEYLKNINFTLNRGYHNFDLMSQKDSKIQRSLLTLSNAIKNEELKLQPITQFSNSEIIDAIDIINDSNHIGKVVVKHDHDIYDEIYKNNSFENDFSILKSNYQINSSNLGKNILITGQSGIILEILKWMIKYSTINTIDNIIILSKSSLKWELELLINKTKQSKNNIKFHFKSVDVGDSEQVDNAINEIINENKEIKNIDSIFHFAFTQVACKVEEITMKHLDISHGAKTMGTINLHNQSIKRNWKLINFVISSSIASLFGSTDQCSYLCANIVLDSLSRYRESIGLPSTSINLGAIQSTGFVSKNESISVMLDGTGFLPTPINQVLGLLDLQIQNHGKFTNSIVSKFNPVNFSNNEQSSLLLKLDYFSNIYTNGSTKTKERSGIINVDELFIKKISDLFSIDDSKINKDIRLIDYGADSLVIVQLKNWVDKEIGSNLITIQQLQNNTINISIKIISNYLEKLNKKIIV
ncbi:hypothetical protein RB653_009875 [Dictyostelium firmibasis]|uniref:Uncharacterized protein n=1 Tax=Dictyostelium firmibasis TaxID=79012 RepID=A0AAN7TJA1_9MYCE